MPHFKNKSKDYIISTNFKVMYSTLRKQPELKKLKEELIWLYQPRVNYVLGRNPYKRLESFYRDKLNKDLGIDKKLVRSQKIFLKPLGLSLKNAKQEIVASLSQLTFEEFIMLLPQVYLNNRHLHPQLKIFKNRKNIHKLKLESKTDLDFMNEKLGINTEIKANTTRKNNFELDWNTAMYKVVNKLYGEDFNFFGYEKISGNV